MTSGLFASPRRPGRRRALVVLVAAAGAAAAIHHDRARPPAPALDAGVEKPQAAAPAPAAVTEPAPPSPDAGVWRRLARCLGPPDQARGHVTADQVRRWVEIDHLPAWTEGASWWLPMSGEGTPRFPSGLYAIVPADDAPCGVAIVN
jgi:hypothetical protein